MKLKEGRIKVSELIINTSQDEAIKIGRIYEDEICIQLGPIGYNGEFISIFHNFINKEQAEQIISHLKKEFQL